MAMKQLHAFCLIAAVVFNIVVRILAEGPTRNGQSPLAKAPVDGHLGRGFAIVLLPYLPHQLYQGLNVSSLVSGEQQASGSLWVVVAIIFACKQHQLVCSIMLSCCGIFGKFLFEVILPGNVHHRACVLCRICQFWMGFTVHALIP